MGVEWNITWLGMERVYNLYDGSWGYVSAEGKLKSILKQGEC